MLIKAEETLGGVEEARAIIERVHNPVSFSPCLIYIIFSYYPNHICEYFLFVVFKNQSSHANHAIMLFCECVLLSLKLSCCQDDCRAYCLCWAQLENTASCSSIATKLIFIWAFELFVHRYWFLWLILQPQMKVNKLGPVADLIPQTPGRFETPPSTKRKRAVRTGE